MVKIEVSLLGNKNLLNEFCDAAVAAGEEDGCSFFGDAAGVEAGGGEEGPGHSVIGGEVDAGGAATDEVVAADEFYAAAIAMGRGSRADPGLAAVIGEIAILFL